MQGLPQAPKGPDSIACTACIRLVEWRDRKSITLTRTTNPSISLACVPRMSEGGEMQGPQTKGPLVKLLVEDSIAPARHAFVWSSARS
jgi:hypothetical protein